MPHAAALLGIALMIFASTPAGSQPAVGSRDLEAQLQAFRSSLAHDSLTLDNGPARLDYIYRDFFLADPTTFALARLQHRARPVCEDIFRTRQQLRDAYRSVILSAPSLDDPRVAACVRSMRQVSRAARFAEDYIVEWDEADRIARKKHSPPVEKSPSPYLMFRDSAVDHLELRTGDIFVQRSPSSVSAGVARIASIASQFSHAGFIYIDPRDGRRYIIDSQMTDGVRYRPIENLLAGSNVRIAFFRFEDPEIARCAAEKARADAVEAGKGREKIHYDFPNDMDDHGRIFCAELVRAEIAECAREQGKTVAPVPLFPSAFGKKNRSLLNAMGIRSEVTFEPGDIEVDPRFELFAEWRDFKKLKRNRHYDAILTKIFEWMDEDGYTFQVGGSWRFMINRIWNMEAHGDKSGPPGSWLTGWIRNPIRKAVVLDVKNDDTGLKKDGAGQAIELDRLSHWLDHRLDRIEKHHQREARAASGFAVPMTYRELLASLDSLKVTDLKKRKRFRVAPMAVEAN
jgi:hypothetical protein